MTLANDPALADIGAALDAVVPPPSGEEALPDGELLALLQPLRDNRGRLQADFPLLVTLLSRDSLYRGKLRFNKFSASVEMADERGSWRNLQDPDIRAMRLDLSQRYSIQMGSGSNNLIDAILTVAEKSPVNPLEDFIFGLLGLWDGTPRISKLFTDYFIPVEKDSLYEVYAVKWMLMAIHRALHPGSTAQAMLILQGPQGRGKSRGVKALCPDDSWFSRMALDPDNKDTVMIAQGKWFVEVGELVGLDRATVESMKFFISKEQDEIRPPYGHGPVKYPRRCLFVGSTNSNTFLNDDTGSRRYWVIPFEGVDVEKILRDRVQLWAEAYTRYIEGCRPPYGYPVFWLSDEEEQKREELANLWSDEEPWANEVRRWLQANGSKPFEMSRVLLEVFQDPHGDNRGRMLKVGGFLRKQGYEKKRTSVDGVMTTRWAPLPTCRIRFTPASGSSTSEHGGDD